MATPIKFNGYNTIFGEDQEGVFPLPAHVDKDGAVLTCWELTPEERLEVFNTGKVFVRTQTYGNPLQPMNVIIE